MQDAYHPILCTVYSARLESFRGRPPCILRVSGLSFFNIIEIVEILKFTVSEMDLIDTPLSGKSLDMGDPGGGTG